MTTEAAENYTMTSYYIPIIAISTIVLFHFLTISHSVLFISFFFKAFRLGLFINQIAPSLIFSLIQSPIRIILSGIRQFAKSG